MKLKIAVVFVVLPVLMLSGCKYVEGLMSSTTPAIKTPTTTTTTVTPPKTTTPTITVTSVTTTPAGGLEIVSDKMINDEQGRKVVMLVLLNNSGVKIDVVKVTVRFLDSHGNLVDSSIDSTANLLPGQSTDLVIPCFGTCENVTGYDVNIETTIN